MQQKVIRLHLLESLNIHLSPEIIRPGVVLQLMFVLITD